MRPRAALTVDFLKWRRSGLLPALGNELLWFSRRLSWPCGAGRPGYRERFPRSNRAQERSGRTDRGRRLMKGPISSRAPEDGFPSAVASGDGSNEPGQSHQASIVLCQNDRSDLVFFATPRSTDLKFRTRTGARASSASGSPRKSSGLRRSLHIGRSEN